MNPYIEILIRTLVVFILLVILARIIGRKLLSQLSVFEFVTTITIGSATGTYVVERSKGNVMLLSPIILTICAVGLGYLTLKSLRFRKLVVGEPVVIIQNGEILEKNMLKARYSLDDLERQLRGKGAFKLNEVEFAVLESDGTLSVQKKSSYIPVTPKDLNLSTTYKGLATEIIKDGEVLEQNLRQNNLDFNWLYNQLRKNGVSDISDVMLAHLNTDGTLYLDLKKQKPAYTQQVED
ncbi:uncharacterized membrane protein YcaP (DUF421 family) [Orenia metallireducens]|uniref:Uncharacterized membrane protein YcaP, DUF421 family n=1 Tax=Orenia metallireducens TaxID=1413210 RepID=A0A285GH07_9FIRM|nr:DUF421 domain-containing protein [Orenia metallireducens]PRX30499.1 uncharacterized membrane protein YcaP (DUF421 family) [Orenia metallireducens]SNY22890.1 Uncharacterized membrane protein YcaP, DUF421 family [Orenia metallireducens]